jgi:cytoskeletal protein RodZ
MDGAVAVTSKWSRLFFISYYVVAVVMVLNLVVAFVVEAYFETTQPDAKGSNPRDGSSRAADTSASSDRRQDSSSHLSSSTPPPRSPHEHGQRMLTQRDHRTVTSAPTSVTRGRISVEDFL